MNNPYTALMPITQRPDKLFVEGRGSWLLDSSGNRYLDFVQGWAVNALGHCHPAVVEALQQQAARLINPSPAFYNQPMLELAERLTTHSHFDEVFFTNSGAEANEGAIKLARKWGALHKQGASRIITFEHGFHGRTLATMAASGKPGWDALFAPRTPGFTKVPYNDADAVAAAIDTETVAILLEPIQGEAGVIPAETGFVRALQALCTKHDLLLIFDEVQTGMGRTGSLFACQQLAVEPDIMTLGKGIGGGVPLAALLTTHDISCFAPGDQGGTFNGNPLCCAAGLAVIDTLLAPGFMEQVRDTANYLEHRLKQLSGEQGLGEVRGQGLLLALDTTPLNAPVIAARAFEKGLMLNAPRPHTLRFMPALTVTTAEIDEMITLLKQTISTPETTA